MFGLENKELLLYGGAGLGGLAVLFILFKVFFGGKKKPAPDLQKGQRETLDEYPDPPPATKGRRRLLCDGVEVRLRLVVLSPAGKQHDPIDIEVVPEILDDLRRGLGAYVKADKPRVKIWPPQLSAAGFAPTFFRLVESPDDDGQKSHWIRLAGPVKIGGKPHLLGLALYSEEMSKIGALDLDTTEWTEHLHIEK